MAPQELPHRRPSLYPQVDDVSIAGSSSAYSPNPNPNLKSASSPSPLYPSVDTSDLHNLFPDDFHNPSPRHDEAPSAPPMAMPEPVEETIITVPGAIVHLIDKQYSIELGVGDFSIVRIRQADNLVAVLARLSEEVQWPLMKDVAVVKVDDSHYFFSFPDVDNVTSSSIPVSKEADSKRPSGEDGSDLLNYGLSFASKGQESILKDLDRIFESYGNFSVQGVSEKSKGAIAGMGVAREVSPEDLQSDKEKRETMAQNCGAYWTTLAPNVEEYSGTVAKFIATGSGQLIKGILWCGDVAVDRLNWGHEVLKNRLEPSEKREVDEKTLKRIQRVKRMTMRTQKVANGVLTGVVKVSGFFTSSFANSKMGKRFFSLIPGEVLLASLDGFSMHSVVYLRKKISFLMCLLCC